MIFIGQEREYKQTDEILIASSSHEKYKYEYVDNAIKKVDILDFISIEDTPRRKRKLELPLTAAAETSVSPQKTSKSLAAFRSTKSGYHASTAPDQFVKKKYSSPRMKSVNRVVFPGSMNMLSKDMLYSNILSSYPQKKHRKRNLKTFLDTNL